MTLKNALKAHSSETSFVAPIVLQTTGLIPKGIDHSSTQREIIEDETQTLEVRHELFDDADNVSEFAADRYDGQEYDPSEQSLGKRQFPTSMEATVPPVISVDNDHFPRHGGETTRQRIASRKALQAAYRLPNSISMLRQMAFSERDPAEDR